MSLSLQTPGTFPRPGWMGRIVRLLMGGALLYFLMKLLPAFDHIVGYSLPRGGLFWVGIALAFYALPLTLNPLFGRNIGRTVQLVVAGLALIAAGYDWLAQGQIWGPPLGLLAFSVLAFVLGETALAFLLAALFAVPG